MFYANLMDGYELSEDGSKWVLVKKGEDAAKVADAAHLSHTFTANEGVAPVLVESVSEYEKDPNQPGAETSQKSHAVVGGSVEDLTKAQLVALAKERGVEVSSSATKAELVEALS